jgi:alkylated DNA repair protein (DNA oxidative demethylase)
MTVGDIDDPMSERLKPMTDFSGLQIHSEYLDRDAQMELVAAVRSVFASAPLYAPRMPKSGRPFSVRMSNCGPLGWVSDETGYRYQATHPETGQVWPPMPPTLVTIWNELGGYREPPEACLINFYGPAAKMGLHQDRDEADFDAPVISISLGDSCRFRVGGLKRSEPTRAFRLSSGDALVLGGASRLAFHGVDRIYPGTSRLLPEGGRINLTLRRVTRSAPESSSFHRR